jgi:hypothetical protein
MNHHTWLRSFKIVTNTFLSLNYKRMIFAFFVVTCLTQLRFLKNSHKVNFKIRIYKIMSSPECILTLFDVKVTIRTPILDGVAMCDSVL